MYNIEINEFFDMTAQMSKTEFKKGEPNIKLNQNFDTNHVFARLCLCKLKLLF